MTCPECGYMMTAFEKECARCKATEGRAAENPYVAHQRRLALEQQDAPHPAPSPPLVTPAPPDAAPAPVTLAEWSEPSAAPASQRRRFPILAVVGLVGLAFLLAVVLLLFEGAHRQATEQAAERASQSDLVGIKREGYGECSAGDVESCQYYMNKLRDVEDYNDVSFLKDNLIVSLYLKTTPGMYLAQDKYRQGTLTPTDLNGIAMAAALDGERDVKDAALDLAEYGPPSRFITGNAQPAPPSAPAQSQDTPAPSAPPPGLTMKTKAGGGAPPHFDAQTGTLGQ